MVPVAQQVDRVYLEDMIRFLTRVVVYIGSAALGLWVTSLLLDKFDVKFTALIIAALIFAVLQSLLAPLVRKGAAKFAPALESGVGVITTFAALLLTTLFTETKDFHISGISTWILGTIAVWIFTAVAGWLLEALLKPRSKAEEPA